MSQFTHLGIDIYPQGDIPKESLKVPAKLNWAQRTVKAYLEKHPNCIKYLVILNKAYLLFVILGMAANIFFGGYILYKSTMMSFTIQSEYGFQAMIITLLTLFTYVLITAVVITSKAVYKLINSDRMNYKEASRRIWAIQWRGTLFWVYSLFCGVVLISVPTLLAPTDFNNLPDNAKAARFIILFLMLLIEKILETFIVAKLD